MRAIIEQENATKGVAGLPEYQEDRRSNFSSPYKIIDLSCTV